MALVIGEEKRKAGKILKLRVLFVSNNSWKFNGILEYVLGETMESVHRQ